LAKGDKIWLKDVTVSLFVALYAGKNTSYGEDEMRKVSMKQGSNVVYVAMRKHYTLMQLLNKIFF
jgi:hypothetical protein